MAIYKGEVLADTLEIAFTTKGQVLTGVNLNSEQPLFKIAKEGKGTIISDSTPDWDTVTIDHNLGYKPTIAVFIERVPGARMRSIESLQDIPNYLSTDLLQAGISISTTQVFFNWFTNGAGSQGTYKYYYIVYYDPIDETQ